jgi:hypothetical protein
MRRILMTFLGLLLGCAYPRYPAGMHYFAWVNLYVDPPIPTEPITEERAQAIARNGEAYSIGEYNSKGELEVLRKVYRGQDVVVWRATRPDGGSRSTR